MGADREARSLKARAEQVTGANADPGDLTVDGQPLTELAALADLPPEDHWRAVLDLDARYQDDEPRLRKALEAEIIRQAAEERAQARKAPKRQASRRRPKADDATTGQPQAPSDVVESLPDSDANAPVEPVVGDLTRPMRTMPGHPQSWPSSQDAGPLWFSDPKTPHATDGRPLPPRPPTTPNEEPHE